MTIGARDKPGAAYRQPSSGRSSALSKGGNAYQPECESNQAFEWAGVLYPSAVV
jgi:hypothetical protein